MKKEYTVTYVTTFQTVTPESAAAGDFEDQGFIDEEGTPATFRELVKLLAGTSPSCHPLPPPEDCGHIWYSEDQSTDYQSGEETTYCYHPIDERAGRYMAKAWLYANKKSI